MVSGYRRGCRPKLLRPGRRDPVDLGADAGLVSWAELSSGTAAADRRCPVDLGAEAGLVHWGRGCRPELLRLGRRRLVDLGLASGLDGEGVLMVLVLADRDT